jgi:hypothetical protein
MTLNAMNKCGDFLLNATKIQAKKLNYVSDLTHVPTEYA